MAIVTLILLNRARLTALRESIDAGANAAVLPVLSVSSLVGYGAVIAALPAFALGSTYLQLAAQHIDPALMHRLAVISSGTLDSLPHNGAVVTLLAVCGSTHRESYRDIVMVGIVGALLALVIVIAIGSVAGSF